MPPQDRKLVVFAGKRSGHEDQIIFAKHAQVPIRTYRAQNDPKVQGALG